MLNIVFIEGWYRGVARKVHLVHITCIRTIIILVYSKIECYRHMQVNHVWSYLRSINTFLLIINTLLTMCLSMGRPEISYGPWIARLGIEVRLDFMIMLISQLKKVNPSPFYSKCSAITLEIKTPFLVWATPKSSI